MGREGDDVVRRILYGIMFRDLDFKANKNEVGRLARNHSIIVQGDEWRTARKWKLLW